MKKLLFFLALLFGVFGFISSSKKNIPEASEVLVMNEVVHAGAKQTKGNSVADINSQKTVNKVICDSGCVSGSNTGESSPGRHLYFLLHNKYGNDR